MIADVVEPKEEEEAEAEGAVAFDPRAVRRDFPILDARVRGKPLVYLDSAATSQKPLAVLRALEDHYRSANANIHRGIHTLSERATRAYEDAREKVREFLAAPASEGVVFVRNATEAINLVAYSWGRRNVRAGDEIATTILEHHANIVPWHALAKETGARVRFCPIRADGTLDLDALRSILASGRVKLVAVAHVSNVLGTINPVAEIVRLAHDAGALCLVDGCQAAPHLPVDVAALGCDFYAVSGHKMLGPTGIGALVARPEVLRAMPPFLGGGEMIRSVTVDDVTYNDIPWRFEAGTPAIAEAVAFGAAVDWLAALPGGMAAARAHDERLVGRALAGLGAVPGVTIYGPREAARRCGCVAFNVAGVHPHDLAQVLDQEGIAIRSGHHCAEPLVRSFGVGAMARASFQVYNLESEVDALVSGVTRAQRFFGAAPPG